MKKSRFSTTSRFGVTGGLSSVVNKFRPSSTLTYYHSNYLYGDDNIDLDAGV